MIPDSTKRLGQLEGGSEPQWFAHQDEINRLLLSRSRVEGDALQWFSSWDCPFPDRLNGLKAPQPDYLLVTARDGKASLTFGEHDRATEPMARWMEKLAAYAAAREVAEELFGYAEFTVDVTVTDPLRRAPHRRVREIVDTVRAPSATDSCASRSADGRMRSRTVSTISRTRRCGARRSGSVTVTSTVNSAYPKSSSATSRAAAYAASFSIQRAIGSVARRAHRT